jgi:hypothetical protein
MAAKKTRKCLRCGNNFEYADEGLPILEEYCEKCKKIVKKVDDLEDKLIHEEFSIEKKDEEIAKQIDFVITREGLGSSKEDEDLLNSLTKRLLKDETRRKKILKHIKTLQKEKD